MQTPSEAPATKRRVDVRRLYAALLFIPLFYVLVRHLPPLFFFGLVVGAALLAQFEFYRLYFRDDRVPVLAGLGLGAGAWLLASLQWPGALPERVVVLVAVMAALASRLLASREIKQSLADSSVMVFGVLYVSLTLGHLLLTRALPGGEYLIFFLILVTWAGDTGAYYAGVALGRHKLAPVVSPNKTIEGLAGGLALAVAMAFIAQRWFLPAFTMLDCVATGLLLTGAGVLGDLSESAMKRSAEVKDSGAVIPGHGGMLDRLDSLLFTAPTFYYYMVVIKG